MSLIRVYVSQRPDVRWFENPILRRIQRVFVHNYFSYFGSFIAVANVIVISVSRVIITSSIACRCHGYSILLPRYMYFL